MKNTTANGNTLVVKSVGGKLLGSFAKSGAMSIADKIKAAAQKAASGGTSTGGTVSATPEVTSVSSATLKANAKSGHLGSMSLTTK